MCFSVSFSIYFDHIDNMQKIIKRKKEKIYYNIKILYKIKQNTLQYHVVKPRLTKSLKFNSYLFLISRENHIFILLSKVHHKCVKLLCKSIISNFMLLCRGYTVWKILGI